ncbi:MAG: hypothetical protein OK439_05880 [Thaumarchaeota archaeon]|nr:hypothetical protein [Nitrososphaerota archaeon]
MNTVAVAVIVLLITASAGVGYFIGSSVSSSTTSQLPQLSIVNASWALYSKTIETGTCGIVYSGVGFQFGFGNPEAACDLTISPSQSGTINLNVTNSGNRVNFAFDTVSSYPYMVFFANSQGCTQFNGVGFCGLVEKNSAASFQLTFLSTSGNYKPINVTLDVELAILSS